uniref:Uncharacterized protein n=1 Tax=Magallana gigas TaxID=29159 RepID=K1QSU8_MAGGI
MPAIVQGEGAVRNVSSFKKSTIESLIPGKKYKILNATSHPTFGIELKADSVVNNGHLIRTDRGGKKNQKDFFNPKTYNMADASSLANSTRLSLSPVQVKSIGETGVVSTGSQRREVQLSMDGRSALLTLWGKATDLEVVAGDMYIVRNIVPSNDFNKQRCYSSTPLTKFEPYECTELQETFEGVVESVSFASNLIEINDMMLTISKDNLAKIFPGRQFSAVQVTGLKRNGEICEIDVKKAKM